MGVHGDDVNVSLNVDMSSVFVRSKYDPLDFFSYPVNQRKVDAQEECALNNMESRPSYPQNNLLEGIPVFPHLHEADETVKSICCIIPNVVVSKKKTVRAISLLPHSCLNDSEYILALIV